MTKNENNKKELIRFTTLIDPKVLSNIKLISYFTNKKLYEIIDDSCNLLIDNFETQNNTSIKTLINLQHKFSNNITTNNDIEVKDKK
jgi:hypothetical protein